MPTLKGRGPFSYETLDFNSGNTYALNAGSATAPKTQFDSTNGETLDVSAATTLAVKTGENTTFVTIDGATLTGAAAGTTVITIGEVDLTQFSFGQEPDGDGIVRANVPTITTDTDITVTVT